MEQQPPADRASQPFDAPPPAAHPDPMAPNPPPPDQAEPETQPVSAPEAPTHAPAVQEPTPQPEGPQQSAPRPRFDPAAPVVAELHPDEVVVGPEPGELAPHPQANLDAGRGLHGETLPDKYVGQSYVAREGHLIRQA